MLRPPNTIEELIAQLLEDGDPSHEAIASELGVLQSIYGEDALKIWWPPHRARSESPDRGGPPTSPEPGTTRYEVTLSIDGAPNVSQDPDQPTTVSVLVSLPSTYPAENPPQLQLLSRYIGPYGVDVALFGTVLRTYISRGAVEWAPGTECVFDGLEWVREQCATWLRERTSENMVGAMLREEGRSHVLSELVEEERAQESSGPASEQRVVPEGPVEMPAGVTIVEAEPILDRKSAFVGRACRITHPSQVPLVLAHLMSDRRISRAAHPIINAWRCREGLFLHQDNDDDGENAGGGRLAHLLQILEVEDVLVVVTRYFGGIHLGPDRFKHINQAARNALELGGFLDVPDDPHAGGRKQGKGKGSKR
ncbi:ribosomal protein S5 domain 2-type protein [Epithele typhae]|uniref:ribosomal protein S5 domain 2-type protein n=1 Tax=Epithele typhae TaxID=378194 RepID=UPI00200799C1|nr:ribosomal protein S5 domain 2-type protein [Epithele typhae]KAH9939391.1 ribosomal protein S5 domain 2-type protein [Epithele typhae]